MAVGGNLIPFRVVGDEPYGEDDQLRQRSHRWFVGVEELALRVGLGVVPSGPLVDRFSIRVEVLLVVAVFLFLAGWTVHASLKFGK